eukprot:GHVS01056417.1.p1 GENE.GHVS01056417.1~~GHVS01056417.1.p1  ORF type:complete len:597 (-),score=155.87 GHVS01056417.1:115-1905(-)
MDALLGVRGVGGGERGGAVLLFRSSLLDIRVTGLVLSICICLSFVVSPLLLFVVSPSSTGCVGQNAAVPVLVAVVICLMFIPHPKLKYLLASLLLSPITVFLSLGFFRSPASPPSSFVAPSFPTLTSLVPLLLPHFSLIPFVAVLAKNNCFSFPPVLSLQLHMEALFVATRLMPGLPFGPIHHVASSFDKEEAGRGGGRTDCLLAADEEKENVGGVDKRGKRKEKCSRLKRAARRRREGMRGGGGGQTPREGFDQGGGNIEEGQEEAVGVVGGRGLSSGVGFMPYHNNSRQLPAGYGVSGEHDVVEYGLSDDELVVQQRFVDDSFMMTPLTTLSSPTTAAFNLSQSFDTPDVVRSTTDTAHILPVRTPPLISNNIISPSPHSPLPPPFTISIFPTAPTPSSTSLSHSALLRSPLSSSSLTHLPSLTPTNKHTSTSLPSAADDIVLHSSPSSPDVLSSASAILNFQWLYDGTLLLVCLYMLLLSILPFSVLHLSFYFPCCRRRLLLLFATWLALDIVLLTNCFMLDLHAAVFIPFFIAFGFILLHLSLNLIYFACTVRPPTTTQQQQRQEQQEQQQEQQEQQQEQQPNKPTQTNQSD